MLLNFFIKSFKKSPLMPVWHFTKNTKFVGDKELNIVCFLNPNHILFSSKGVFHVAAHQEIPNNIRSAFDTNTFAMDNSLVVLTELNETCENVFAELSQEANTAGLHGL